MTPYFERRSREKRLCPECHEAHLQVRPTLNPNVAYDRCPACGYLHTVEAPERFRVAEPARMFRMVS